MATTFASNTDAELRITADTLATLTGATPYTAAVVDRARDQANGLIKAKVGVRYLLADATVAADPGLAAYLRELELNLVEYFLWSRQREDLPERIKTQYENTVKLLAEIATGKAVLPSIAQVPTNESGIQAEIDGPERIFTRPNMEGMF